MNILLGSLLIPSISTKTISLSEETYYRQPSIGSKTGIFINKNSNFSKNKFVILVGNIGVVYLQFDGKLENTYTIMIDMPITTRLPVSRDDILFDSEFTINVFILSLELLRNEWAFNKLFDFTILEDGLRVYANYTRQNIVKKMISIFID